MTFFQEFPVPPLPPRGRATRYVPPAWAGAPPSELPAVLHVGQFLHRSPTMVMAVKSVDVFSTGCSFDVCWTIRRGEQTDEEWADLNDAFFRGRPGARRGSGAASMLLFGAAFPDGAKASTGAHPHGVFDGTQQPPAPVLLLRNGGGNGGDDEFSGTGTLWLWPLPPAGDLRVLAQWREFGLEECSIVLEGARLRDAAPGVQKFW
ncbi:MULTISPECIES: hypothetical protein [Arthrobacter]|uniref:Uncharacterized protein n=1 Tax=Arthrobacter humicola TaxID=409291 RepID=A0ABP5LDR0_9MICC|nr:hypothetical protein [Arthrobacter sp. H-02-3]PVZ54064.1 hypothetical protein C9424_16320 [Arthrobacter sp. H-02-3]